MSYKPLHRQLGLTKRVYELQTGLRISVARAGVQARRSNKVAIRILHRSHQFKFGGGTRFQGHVCPGGMRTTSCWTSGSAVQTTVVETPASYHENPVSYLYLPTFCVHGVTPGRYLVHSFTHFLSFSESMNSVFYNYVILSSWRL
jgi:hypothetical protein